MKAPAEQLRLPLLAVLVGLTVAVAGIGLLKLIWLITNLSFHGTVSVHEHAPDFSTLGPWGILVPCAGGLLIGLIARFGSAEVRGHGIPEAMQGVIVKRSRISLKIAVLKPLSTAISIGTGGPFGAEGPIIASGGVGNLDHLVDGILDGRADAVLAASVFHYGELTVGQAKTHMARAGIEVRI